MIKPRVFYRVRLAIPYVMSNGGLYVSLGVWLGKTGWFVGFPDLTTFIPCRDYDDAINTARLQFIARNERSDGATSR